MIFFFFVFLEGGFDYNNGLRNHVRGREQLCGVVTREILAGLDVI